ncbi:hypothetical protein GCM10010293_56040 [Streptomyces griseoflavus]|nr:hypothetical protein GCM10010293_56040 [Streptomyces griseoflavus]
MAQCPRGPAGMPTVQEADPPAEARPDWFGRTGDALVDCLADHTVRPEGAVEWGLLSVVRDGRPYAAARPGEWATATDVCAGAADRTASPTVAPALGGTSDQGADQHG